MHVEDGKGSTLRTIQWEVGYAERTTWSMSRRAPAICGSTSSLVDVGGPRLTSLSPNT